MKFSILIPSLISREASLNALRMQIDKQAKEIGWTDSDYEIVTHIDNGAESIGKKRNDLLNSASGMYVAFIDDDDEVGSNYLRNIAEGIGKNVDCCSLLGVITWDDKNPELFEHSIKYKEYKTAVPTSGIKYERYPNHLNCIRTAIARQFKFPATDFGEDTDWATQVFKSGLIKKEHYISDVIYHYKFKTNK